MRLSSKMSLTLWDDFVNDPYSPQQLLDNWLKVDFHDHSPGRGVQIARAGIAAGSVGPNQLGTDIPWVPSEGTIGLRPTAGVFGRLYYATDTDTWYADNGVSWERIGGGNPLNVITSEGALTMSNGTVSLTWPGGSQVSNSISVTHNLGTTPQWVHCTVSSGTMSGNPVFAWASSYNSTVFSLRGAAILSNVASGSYGTVAWMALG